jgi:MFS family permease
MQFFKRFSYWGQFHKNVKLMLLTNLITQTGIGMFMVIYNLYVYALGYPETFIGQIISINSLATVLIMLPAGLISDRVGRRRILLISGVIVALTYFARVFIVQSFPMLAFSFLTGIFSSFISVSVVPYLSENSQPNERIHLFSLNAALMMLAQMFGNMMGGFSADFFIWSGFEKHHSYQYTLAIASLVIVIGLVPLLFIRDKKAYSEERDEVLRKQGTLVQKENGQRVNKKRQWKTILIFAGAGLPIGLGAGLVIPYLNLYFMNRFHASNSEIGFIISLGQLATFFATLIGPALVKKIGEVKTVVFLQLLSIPFLLLTGYTTFLGVAVMGFLLRQALMNAGNPIQQTLMMSKVDDSMKGVASSVSQMTFMIGWATMGPIATAFVQHYGNYWGYAWLFTITAILYLIGSIYYLVVIGRIMREKQERTGLEAGM